MIRFLFITILIIICFGCASTNLTSFVDPQVKNKQYKKVMVYFPSSDLDEQTKGEDILKEEFLENRINAYRSLDFFLPTREYSDNEIMKILINNDVDAVLLVEFVDAYTDQSYVPQSNTTTTKGQVTAYGNTARYKENSKTYSYGGYYINKPRIKFISKLIDVNEDIVAWIGSSLTKGNAYAGFGTLISSLGSNIVEDLLEKKLLK